MHSALEGIIAQLQEQKQVLEQLLALSHEKREVIIAGNTDRLTEIVQLELRSLSTIRHIERGREQRVAELSAVSGVPAETLTISALIELAQGEQRLQLKRLQVELVQLLGAQMTINRLNAQLLETQLEFSNVMLNLLVGTDDPLNNIYSGDGLAAGGMRANVGLFDRQT